MFNLRQLRYFVAVAETEHVGRAAEILNISQSPLSRQILELEADLGLDLFHRSKKRLKLTAVGRDFLAESKILLARADRLARKVDAIGQGRTGALIVGYVDGAIHSEVIASTLKSGDERIRSIDLRLLPMRSKEQFEKLESGEIDISLAYQKPFDLDRFISTQIHSEPFVLAAPAQFNLATNYHADELDGQNFVWLPEKEFVQARADFLKDCLQAGFKPNISLEATGPLAALDLVRAGLGFAVVQESLQRLRFEDVSFRNLPSTYPGKLEIFLSHRRDPTPVEQVFLDAIRRLPEAPSLQQPKDVEPRDHASKAPLSL